MNTFRSFSNIWDDNARYSAATVEEPETYHNESGLDPWNVVEAVATPLGRLKSPLS